MESALQVYVSVGYVATRWFAGKLGRRAGRPLCAHTVDTRFGPSTLLHLLILCAVVIMCISEVVYHVLSSLGELGYHPDGKVRHCMSLMVRVCSPGLKNDRHMCMCPCTYRMSQHWHLRMWHLAAWVSAQHHLRHPTCRRKAKVKVTKHMPSQSLRYQASMTNVAN